MTQRSVTTQTQRTPDQDEKNRAAFLLEDMRRRARLPPEIPPEEALRAIMCTFSRHVSGGEARQVWDALPRPVRPLLDRCMVHRDEHAERFGRDQFLVRVAEHLGVAIERAEEIAAGVLTAVSATLPAKEVADVASQLPADLRDLWVVNKVPLAPPIEPHPILSRIEKSVPLPAGVTGLGAFESTVCNLSRRLSLAEARHFFSKLPADLRQLVEPCLRGRGERPEPFDKTQYLQRVARDFDITDLVEGERIARNVFRHLEEYITADVLEHVMNQLPKELSDIWALPDVP